MPCDRGSEELSVFERYEIFVGLSGKAGRKVACSAVSPVAR